MGAFSFLSVPNVIALVLLAVVGVALGGLLVVNWPDFTVVA